MSGGRLHSAGGCVPAGKAVCSQCWGQQVSELLWVGRRAPEAVGTMEGWRWRFRNGEDWLSCLYSIYTWHMLNVKTENRSQGGQGPQVPDQRPEPSPCRS